MAKIDDLITAIKNSKINEALQLLKDKDVQREASSNDNEALRIAAENGYLEVVEALLNIESVRENANALNNAALHTAVEKGYIEIVKKLLAVESVINNLGDYLNEMMEIVAKSEDLEQLKMLLKNENLVKKLNGELLYGVLEIAVQKKDNEILDSLLKIESVVEKNKDALNKAKLLFAVLQGQASVVQELFQIDSVKNDADICQEAFRKAVSEGHGAVVEVLLKIDSIKNNPDLCRDAIEEAFGDVNLAVVAVLLKTDTLTNDTEIWSRILQAAVLEGHLEVAQAILKVGSRVENAGEILNQILCDACGKGYFEVVQALLEIESVKNFNVGCEDALMVAVKRGCPTIIDVLLKTGAPVNLLEIIDLLLEKGAQINLGDIEGKTPLYYACEAGNFEVVKRLIARQANPFIRDKDRNLPETVALTNGHDDIVEFLRKIEITPELEREARAYNLATDYIDTLSKLSEMIILGLETAPSVTQGFSIPLQPVSNNEGYISGKPEEGVQEGKALSITIGDETYPIGYNILIPKGLKKVSHVLVSVYGGLTKLDKGIGPLGGDSAALMLAREGCPLITLNLPDLLQEQGQREMTKELHEVIHRCIDHFYQTISTHPEKLHESLQGMGFGSADYFLYGGSFGGRTAVRHGQLYPKTFRGYISHDGALAERPDMPIFSGTDRKYAHPEVLMPSEHIDESEDPILILQNRDDNNVNIRAALTFYQKLLEAEKGHLARLAFFEKGNPAPEGSLWNKGHFLPTDTKRYMDTIFTFMERGPSQLPEFHERAFILQENLAQQFFRKSDDKERFLALALELYGDTAEHQIIFRKKGGESQTQASWNEIWEKHYKPILMALAEIKSLVSNPDYLKQQIESLQKKGLLTDEVIKNAIKRHAAMFRELYRETHDFEDLTIEEISDNPHIVAIFRDKLLHLHESDSFDFKSFMLENLYFSNPGLLPKVEESMAWRDIDFEATEKEFRAAFEAKCERSKKATLTAWKALVKKGQQKSQEERRALRQDLENIDFTNPGAVYKLLYLTDTFFVKRQRGGQEAIKNFRIKVVEKLNINLKQLLIDIQNEIKTKATTPDKQSLEIIDIINNFIKAPEGPLSEQELSAISNYLVEHQWAKDSKFEQNLSQTLWHVLMLDSLRTLTSSENYMKAIRRSVCIEKLVEEPEIIRNIQNHSLTIAKQFNPNVSTADLLILLNYLRNGINVPDEKGDVPIIRAVESGNVPLVKLFIEAGADPEAKNADGQTVLEVAKKRNRLYVADAIEAKTAEKQTEHVGAKKP